jgi:hypothetical protein
MGAAKAAKAEIPEVVFAFVGDARDVVMAARYAPAASLLRSWPEFEAIVALGDSAGPVTVLGCCEYDGIQREQRITWLSDHRTEGRPMTAETAFRSHGLGRYVSGAGYVVDDEIAALLAPPPASEAERALLARICKAFSTSTEGAAFDLVELAEVAILQLPAARRPTVRGCDWSHIGADEKVARWWQFVAPDGTRRRYQWRAGESRLAALQRVAAAPRDELLEAACRATGADIETAWADRVAVQALGPAGLPDNNPNNAAVHWQLRSCNGPAGHAPGQLDREAALRFWASGG